MAVGVICFTGINFLNSLFREGSDNQLVASQREKGKQTMTKTIEIITEALKNPKHPFRKADFRPKKSQKSRYERRKIKEYLHLSDMMVEDAI